LSVPGTGNANRRRRQGTRGREAGTREGRRCVDFAFKGEIEAKHKHNQSSGCQQGETHLAVERKTREVGAARSSSTKTEDERRESLSFLLSFFLSFFLFVFPFLEISTQFLTHLTES
jgi:hypothetical protein